jgi:uncharacterized protein YggT (Ycf19 family)
MAKPRKFRISTGLGLAVLVAVLASLVVATPAIALEPGFLVNDAAKVCHPFQGPPGIGIGGFRWDTACPEGYSIRPLPEPPVPWWQKALDLLDSWLGLRSKILWIPSAGQLALIASLVLLLRRLLQLFQVPLLNKLTNGLGTLVLSALVSFLTVVQPMLDGGLSAYELLAALVLSVGGAAGVWEALKKLVRRPT